MRMDGLEVDLDEFKKMKSMDRDVLIYKNVLAVRHTKTHLVIQYAWLFVLSVVFGLRKYFPF